MSEFEETTDERDPIADAILHGGAPKDDPFETPEESGADVVDEAPTQEELLLGKFKSPDDLADAYKHLESQFTQNNQRLSELEALLMSDDDEPQQVQPWGMAFNGEPENEEQLIGWAERDAGAAAQWAMANANRVPSETVNSLWEHWFETKPAEANAWYVQQQTQQIKQQYEDELASLREQITPLRDQQTQVLFESSLESLESQIPDLADYSEKIQNYIDNIPVDQLHLAFFPQGMDTPEKIQTGVKSLYAIVRMQEQPAQQFAQQTMQQTVQQNAFTQSRQGVADTGPVDYAAKINAAILNG
jgi:predicted  nucleic acid-binding Zn-ribbon protein